MHLFYQNRFERPCTAKLRLRPAPGLFGRPKGLKEIEVTVHAEEALPLEPPIERSIGFAALL